MGHSTDFSGVLKFCGDVTVQQLGHLNTILGKDCRDHPEWNPEMYGDYLTYVDMKITKDYSGIEWDGSEKTYDLVEKINLMLDLMRKQWPSFNLTGKLIAQGEDIMDRWELRIVDGNAIKHDLSISGSIVTCPYCHKEFIFEEK